MLLTRRVGLMLGRDYTAGITELQQTNKAYETGELHTRLTHCSRSY